MERDDSLFNVDSGLEVKSTVTTEGLGLLGRESNVSRIHKAAEKYRGVARQLLGRKDLEAVPRGVMHRVITTRQERFYGCLSLPVNLLFFLCFVIAVAMHEDITTVYMVESGLRTHLSDGSDDIGDIEGIWSWLEGELMPKLFLQSDSLGVPYQNKSMWSRVLTYNQVTGPVVLEQQRSTKTLCEDGEGVAGDMYCYGQRTSSRDSFGSNQVLPITAPDPREYEGGAVTPAQRRAYYDSAFEVAPSSSRRLAEDTRPEFDFLLPRSFPEDTFQVAIYPNTPSDLIAEHVAYIKNREWLDVRTKLLKISAVLVNAEVGRPRLQKFTIELAQSRGGGFFKQVRVNTLFLEMFPGVASIVFDILFAVFLLGFFLSECFQLGKAIARRKGWKHIKKGWTLLQWLTIFGGAAVLIGYGYEMFLREDVVSAYKAVVANAEEDLPADTSTGIALLNEVEQMSWFVVNFRVVTGLYCLLLMVRFFTAFGAQPRLAVVTKTLEVSAFDIVHFLVVLAPTWLAYALAGCFIFGRRMEEFATLDASIGYCFKLMIEGEYDWPYYSEENYFTTMFWMWTFMVLLNVVMLNLVLAIILDVYGSIRRETGKSETAWLTLWRMLLQLWYRRVWVKSATLLQALEELPAEIRREDLQEKFPSMCNEQLKVLFQECHFQVQMDDQAASQSKRCMKMALSCKLALDQVTDTVKALHSGTIETGGQDGPASDWVQKVADEVAEQNHYMSTLRKRLETVQKQWEAIKQKEAEAEAEAQET